jgi:hypothetical protein
MTGHTGCEEDRPRMGSEGTLSSEHVGGDPPKLSYHPPTISDMGSMTELTRADVGGDENFDGVGYSPTTPHS